MRVGRPRCGDDRAEFLFEENLNDATAEPAGGAAYEDGTLGQCFALLRRRFPPSAPCRPFKGICSQHVALSSQFRLRLGPLGTWEAGSEQGE